MSELSTDILLRKLREACLQATGDLSGCCGAVSLMVQYIAGGDLVAGRVDGCRHYWNRLPDGREVDLTSCQFGGDGWTPLAKGRKTKRPEVLAPVFLAFTAVVLDELRGTGVSK